VNYQLTRFSPSDQLSLLRSLVSENPRSVNAVDTVSVWFSRSDATYGNVGTRRTLVRPYTGLHQEDIWT
jgi:hypothetical protein